jgi:hypothetical protein
LFASAAEFAETNDDDDVQDLFHAIYERNGRVSHIERVLVRP